MSDHSHCHDNDHHHHDRNHGHGHDHGHGHGQGGLHFLHEVIVNNELPLLEGGLTWKQSGLWLDYGCANGDMAKNVFLPHAKACGAKIIGVDRNQTAIDQAKAAGMPEEFITFVKGNILGDWPLDPDTKFDKVIGIHVLQYFQNYEEFLVKVFEILKPGGELGLTLPVEKIVYLFTELEKNAVLGKVDLDPHASEQGLWSANTKFLPHLKEFLVRTGFELKTFEYVPFEHKFDNLDNFTELVAYHWIDGKGLSADKKLEVTNVVKDCIKRVYDDVSPEAKPWPVDISSLVIVAKKPI